MSDETPTPQQPPAPAPAPARPRAARGAVWWLAIALVLSLAINVAFVGFAATRAYHFKHFRDHARSDIGLVMREGRRFYRDLPRERRRELAALFAEHRDEYRAEHDEFRETVRALAEALRADDFDRARLEAAVVTLRTRIDGLVARRSDVAVEILMALSDEERRDLAQRLLDRLE